MDVLKERIIQYRDNPPHYQELPDLDHTVTFIYSVGQYKEADTVIFVKKKSGRAEIVGPIVELVDRYGLRCLNLVCRVISLHPVGLRPIARMG